MIPIVKIKSDLGICCVDKKRMLFLLCKDEVISLENGDEDVVLLTCSSEKCQLDKHVHEECFEAQEEKLLKILRMSAKQLKHWSDDQIRRQMWSQYHSLVLYFSLELIQMLQLYHIPISMLSISRKSTSMCLIQIAKHLKCPCGGILTLPERLPEKDVNEVPTYRISLKT